MAEKVPGASPLLPAQPRVPYTNPLLPAEGVAFIDQLRAQGAASDAMQDIDKIRVGAAESVKVLNEKARRAVNRAKLIQDIAVGEFVPDLMHATYVYELLANRRFDLVDFNLDTLFPAAENRSEIEEYISRFRVPREVHPDIPRMSFPMALGITGQADELDDFMCTTYSTMANIERFGGTKKYFLSKWNQDFEKSFGLTYTPLVTLPVLEDPEPYTFQERGALAELDRGFAEKLLNMYRAKIAELKLEGVRFKAPLIRRLLVVLPGSKRRADYSLEFLPEIAFAPNFKTKDNSDYSGPQVAYDPYAMVQGKPNECDNLLISERGGYLTGSNSRIKMRSDAGNEQMLSIGAFANMNMRDRMEATMGGTVDGEFMGNRLGLVLLPGKTVKKPEPPAPVYRGDGAPMSMFRGGGTFSMGGRDTLSASRGAPTQVSEASVALGTEGRWSSGKRADYGRTFVYEQGGQPIITMVRYLSVVRD